MQQVLQNLNNGHITVENVPVPKPGPRELLIANRFSFISSGTERSKVNTAKKSLLGKALERPDQVRLVLHKIREEGFASAWDKVKNRLETPNPLGYSTAGVVVEVGEAVQGFQVGDAVACAGAEYAHHAEFVAVPVNLCARIPEGVDLAEAATTTLGAIALQGIRQADVRLGEKVLVVGLGVLGQLTAQMLRKAGCAVFGIDLDPRKIDLARSLGMAGGSLWASEGLTAQIETFTNGLGVDAAILTASSPSAEPVVFAAQMARDRARIVIVGQVAMDLPRSPFYEKELSVYFSRSYGPGRYDSAYEEGGVDYPVGHVRWTENRNMQAYIAMLQDGSLKTAPLISHRYPVNQAPEAFERISQPGSELVIGVLLDYGTKTERSAPSVVLREHWPAQPGVLGIGMIGAGNFGASTLLPALKRIENLRLRSICTQHGYRASHLARKFGFEKATSDAQEILTDPTVNGVIIATRHNLHGSLVRQALQAGKAVFVEKPLCLTLEELEEIRVLQEKTHLPVTIGFNRRFSPYAQTLKTKVAALSGPQMMHYRVNAGTLPATHWLKDPEMGGGRLIGEGCHFIDFCLWMAGSAPESIEAFSPEGPSSENISIQIRFANNSHATILYTALGNPALPKERFESFISGYCFVIDNFKALETYGPKGKSVERSWKIQKGFSQEIAAWTQGLSTPHKPSVPFQEGYLSMLATFLARESLSLGKRIRFGDYIR